MQQLVSNYLATNVDKPKIFIYPTDGSWGVSESTYIQLYFSESAIVNSNWSVVIGGTAYTKDSPAIKWLNNNEILEIKPTTGLRRGRTIQVNASGFMSAYRPAPFEDEQSVFTTGGYAPYISIKVPTTTLNVPANSKFTINFSEKPKQTNNWSVVINTVAYTKTYQFISWNAEGTELTIDPMTIYPRGAVFSFSAYNFIADYDDFSFSPFTNTIYIASAPNAVFAPANNETGVSVGTPVAISFTESMIPDNAWTVSINNVVYNASSSGVAWSANNTKLSITPGGGLPALKAIPVVLGGFKAVFDNAPLSGSKQISFTTGCYTEIVKTHVGAHDCIRLKVDANNALHVCYPDTYGSTCVYGTNKSGTWQFETFGDSLSPYIDMVLDDQGNPHIFYMFNHYFKSGGIWQSEPYGTVFVSLFVSAARDTNGAYHVVYTNETTLLHATNKSGLWSQSVIETGNYSNYSSSMALDGQNNVHVSYRNQPSIGNLIYATNSSGVWQKSTIDSAQKTANDTSIAVDVNGKVHISYTYSPMIDDSIIKYATNVSGSWIIRDIDTDPYMNPSTLYLDGAQYPYISLVNRLDSIDYLCVFTNKSGAWKTTLVDKSPMFDSKRAAMGMDSTGVMHVMYTLDDATLRHAWY